jgi:hypothetical protein
VRPLYASAPIRRRHGGRRQGGGASAANGKIEREYSNRKEEVEAAGNSDFPLTEFTNLPKTCVFYRNPKQLAAPTSGGSAETICKIPVYRRHKSFRSLENIILCYPDNSRAFAGPRELEVSMGKKKSIELTATSTNPEKVEKTKKSASKASAAPEKMSAPEVKVAAAAPKKSSKKDDSLKAATAKDAAPKEKSAKSTATKNAKKSPALTEASSVQTAPAPPAAKPATKAAESAANGAGPVRGFQAIPITQEEVAKLAYSYAEARGFQGGSPEEDWFRAEQELRRLRGL